MARKKRKPASGKKKRSRKGKKKQAESAPEAPTVELDADAAPRDTLEAPPVELAPLKAADASPAIELADDEPLVVDLDEEDTADAEVAALIAQTLAGAPAIEEPDEAEPPVIDLDADPQEVEAGSTEEPDVPPLPERASAAPIEEGVQAAAGDDAGAREADSGYASAAGVADALTAEEAIRRLVDRGAVSSPEIRDRLLAEALAHAEHKDARYRVPFSETPTAGRWKALAAFMILLLAGLIAVAPPGWARPDPPAQLPTAERAHSLRAALLLQAEQVEAFRVREQRLPSTLDEVSGALPGVRYVLSGTRAYQLIAYLPDGSAIVYDSTRPTSGFDEVEPSWRAEEGVS